MNKDDSSTNHKVKYLTNYSVKLPEFINEDDLDSQTIENTNIIKVPFGVRFSKRKRPEKNQNIATLILPITSVGNPTPPPHVA